MELCGLHSSSHTHGHRHVQEWHQEASAEGLPQKRKRPDFPSMNGDRVDSAAAFHTKETPSRFVRIDGQKGVYCSESWEPNGSTLYLPVHGTVFANMQKYEQLSFEQGCFCIGHESGGFRQKVQGQALHCWRYSKEDRKLFIALSYFFTNCDAFQEVLSSLKCL